MIDRVPIWLDILEFRCDKWQARADFGRCGYPVFSRRLCERTIAGLQTVGVALPEGHVEDSLRYLYESKIVLLCCCAAQ